MVVLGLLRVFNFSKKKSVTHEMQVKGRNCALRGKRHIKWNNNAQTFHGLEPNWLIHIIIWLIPLLWFKPFNMGISFLLSFIIGIIASLFICGGFNDELASTWCLITIPGMFIGEILAKGKY